ncbi:MAG: (Fe-S)-binding protein [Bacillota bacterium]
MNYTVPIFLAELAAALAVFGYAVRKKVGNILPGKPEKRTDHPWQRIWGFMVLVLGQKKLFKERFGIVHFVIFWGFIIISMGTLQFVGEGLREGFLLPLVGSSPYFYVVKDIASMLVIAAVAVAAFRRFVLRPERLEPSLDAAVILLLITGLILTELAAGGMGLVINPGSGRESAPAYSLVAGAIAASGMGAPAVSLLKEILWWTHVTLLLGFLAYLPYSKHLHLLAAPVNVFFRNLKPRGGQLNEVDLEDDQAEEFGVSRVEGYTRKQLLDLYACAQCGRCQDNCPAFLSGKPLSPKALIRKLKDHLDAVGAGGNGGGPGSGPELLESVISSDEVWSCTTCYSCQEQCPVMNEHINKIIDLRRGLVMDSGQFPSEAKTAFKNMENNYNPWGIGWYTRGDWSKDRGVRLAGVDGPAAEYLYWVGCAGSFDERGRRITESMVRIMQEAGVSFSILGSEEKCCGDSARRLGNEYLFQTLARENIATMKEIGVTKIVVHCPHCFNTLKNEYPALGGNFEVVHHTQLLEQLVARNKIKFRDDFDSLKVAYHDSCYLGRYNGEYAAPRKVLGSVPGITLLEAGRKKERSFCCGAGGGRMWLEEKGGRRINEMRVEQLLNDEPDAVGVNCPFCLTMIEDGLKTLDQESPVKALDVAELVALRLADSPAESGRESEDREEMVS